MMMPNKNHNMTHKVLESKKLSFVFFHWFPTILHKQEKLQVCSAVFEESQT